MDGISAGQHLGTVALGIRHVLCTPLRVVRYVERSMADADQRPIGVLYLDSREKGQLMSPAARNALEAVAGRGGVGHRERAAVPRSDGESADRTRAAAGGRDSARTAARGAAVGRALRRGGRVDSLPIDRRRFFDYFNLPGGQFAFTLGDVAGKGPPAALLTAMIQGAFAAQVTSAGSPAAFMAHINRTLIRRAIQSRFATVMYGVLSPDGRLTYSNAGHNPPMLDRPRRRQAARDRWADPGIVSARDLRGGNVPARGWRYAHRIQRRRDRSAESGRRRVR